MQALKIPNTKPSQITHCKYNFEGKKLGMVSLNKHLNIVVLIPNSKLDVPYCARNDQNKIIVFKCS